jgi:uncharacterized membrane protein YfcA
MHISLGQFIAVAAIVTVGAFAQGILGFGLNLIAAPVVGLVAPELLPATMVVVGVPLSLTIALRDRRSIDWHGVGWTTLGRLPGTAVGAVIVSWVSVRVLGGIVGVAVMVACLVATMSNEHRIGRANSIAAGTASGFMDTVAATGGPPLALLYQHRPAPEVRSTLATSFLVGTVLSIAGLVAGGNVAGWQLLVALALAPMLALGLLLSRLLASRLEGVSLRPAILVFAAAAGAAALIRALAA